MKQFKGSVFIILASLGAATSALAHGPHCGRGDGFTDGLTTGATSGICLAARKTSSNLETAREKTAEAIIKSQGTLSIADAMVIFQNELSSKDDKASTYDFQTLVRMFSGAES